MSKLTKSVGIATFGLLTVLAGGLLATNAKADRVIVVDNPPEHHHRSANSARQVVIVPRNRHYRGIRVDRRHGRPFHGYGFFYSDAEAYPYLAFTAITLKILDNLNEEQERLHEAAQVRATSANVGETIVWNDGGSSGSVATTRIGTSTSGRQCREFQQTVTIAGRTERAYGTACRQADGSWEIVP